MPAKVFIAIGSNLGDRVENCRKAVELIGKLPSTKVIRESSLYETEPWGYEDQPLFLNGAVEIETSLSPVELLVELKRVEAETGRQETFRWGPRAIDLDIVFYGDDVINEGGLTIPHPRAHERPFVLVPLKEIAPDLIHPVLKKTVSELAGQAGEAGVRVAVKR